MGDPPHSWAALLSLFPVEERVWKGQGEVYEGCVKNNISPNLSKLFQVEVPCIACDFY